MEVECQVQTLIRDSEAAGENRLILAGDLNSYLADDIHATIKLQR
jgi:hypothetical protein